MNPCFNCKHIRYDKIKITKVVVDRSNMVKYKPQYRKYFYCAKGNTLVSDCKDFEGEQTMKLIIDIPEDVKGIIDSKGTNEIVVETIWKAVKNGTPLEEEIENIKAEIKPYCWKIKRENEYLVVELEDVNYILNKHIKENKQ